MVNINLVPEKIRSGETLQIIILLGASTLAIPILFWGWRYQGEHAKLSVVQKELASVNDELASPELKQVVADVEQFAKDQSDLASKRSIVDELRKRQVVISRFLDMLPDILPSDGKISTLSITEDKGRKKVVMKCNFLSSEGIASVYENLEASSLIAELSTSDGPKTETIDGRHVLSTTYNFYLQVQP